MKSWNAAQVSAALLFAVFFYALFEVLNPYSSEKEKWLSRVGHLVVVLSMYMALLLKVDVSNEQQRSQEVFADLLVVVHPMMIFTIVAEMVGLCVGEAQVKRLMEGQAQGVAPAGSGSSDHSAMRPQTDSP